MKNSVAPNGYEICSNQRGMISDCNIGREGSRRFGRWRNHGSTFGHCRGVSVGLISCRCLILKSRDRDRCWPAVYQNGQIFVGCLPFTSMIPSDICRII